MTLSPIITVTISEHVINLNCNLKHHVVIKTKKVVKFYTVKG